MSDSDPAAIFRVEAQELLEQIEQGLLDLERRPADTELVSAVFRALHTLKGSGAMFGFDALAAFTHHCETAFDRVRKGEVVATAALIGAVLNARDHMRALAEGAEPLHGAGEALLAELHRVVAAAAGETRPDAAPARETWRIRFQLPADALINGTRPLSLLDELRGLGPCTVTAITDGLPPLEALNPAECLLAWEVTLDTHHPRSAIEDVFIFVIDDMILSIAAVGAAAPDDPVAVLPKLAAVPGTAPPTPANDATPPRPGETVRVPAGRLDELMDRVGELVIAQSRLTQIAAASADPQLRSVSEEIERLAAELRDTMMVVRMVPIASLFGRFRRLIHDLARETGKSVALVTSGEATELDKTVIERLADPLVHLIRNAADHGLERPAERAAARKPPEGQITLAARQAGAEVMITVSDDGSGIDRERVRAKAEDQGLLAPGETIGDAELLQLIFHPGFSTAKEVTNLSGRGVGMDVVKRAIEALRGTLTITSVPGRGSDVSLRIPLTLAIIDGLLVRVGNSRYVVPLSAVEECVELSTGQDRRSTGQNVLMLRGQLVPFLRLREVFATGSEPAAYQKVVVVSTGMDRVGLVVDQILGDHQTVIKPLSRFHAGVETFSGATILGDGGVALILDVTHLVVAGQRQEGRLRAAG